MLNAPGRAPGPKSVRKHLLTGVLQCGRDGCGGYLAGNWVMQANGTGHPITYSCKGCRGVSVRAEHVEPLVMDLIAGRLAQADAVDLLKAELHDEAEAEALRVQRQTLMARLDEIADERADGLMTGPQAKRATDRVTEQFALSNAVSTTRRSCGCSTASPWGSPRSPRRWRGCHRTGCAPSSTCWAP